MIESHLRGFQFYFRERLWGKLSVRQGFPLIEDAAPDTSNQNSEHRFYELLIRKSLSDSER